MSQNAPNETDLIAAQVLESLAKELRAGRRLVTKFAIEDDEKYAIALECVVRQEDKVIVASDEDGKRRCPRCKSTNLKDVGGGDDFCLACQSTSQRG